MCTYFLEMCRTIDLKIGKLIGFVQICNRKKQAVLCLLLACVVGILWGLIRAKRGQQGLVDR